MDFIYYGEANIYQEDLDRFLALAEELQLKGLVKSENANLDNPEEAHTKPKQLEMKKQDNQLKHIDKANMGIENNSIVAVYEDKVLIAPENRMTELRAKLESLMERATDGENIWKCKVCGKSTKGKDARTNMRCHIETHMEGLSYPCNQCDKIRRSSNALTTHVSRNHKV